MTTDSSEDIMRWPDGTWCYRYELDEMSHMSDDYEIIPFGTDRHEQVTTDGRKDHN